MRQERIVTEEWPVALLKPDPRNPRKNDVAVDPTAKSIEMFGFRVPIVIDNEGNIIAGHTRYKAAQKLGIENVPCVVADKLSPKELKAFQLADNKTREFSKWDTGLLAGELDDLMPVMDLSIFGFVRKAKEESKQEKKDKAFVICPRCGKAFPKHISADDFIIPEDDEEEEYEDE